METSRKHVQLSSSLEKRASQRACPGQSRSVQEESRPAVGWGQSKRRIAITLAVLLCAIATSEAILAQSPAASPAPAPVPPAKPDGITSGGYQIHSSIELGYRTNDV